MKRREGFGLKLAALTLVAATSGACGDDGAPAPRPAASPTVATVRFEDIKLPTARVRITRESPSPTPVEVLRVSVKVAGDAESRGRGLMHVDKLPPLSGMVFLYDQPTTTSFYMKNTRIPLDIAFWGEDRKIHEIMQMKPCRSEPCPTYGPSLPFVGALEVNQGLLGRRGVRAGDIVTVTAQTTGGNRAAGG